MCASPGMPTTFWFAIFFLYHVFSLSFDTRIYFLSSFIPFWSFSSRFPYPFVLIFVVCISFLFSVRSCIPDSQLWAVVAFVNIYILIKWVSCLLLFISRPLEAGPLICIYFYAYFSDSWSPLSFYLCSVDLWSVFQTLLRIFFTHIFPRNFLWSFYYFQISAHTYPADGFLPTPLSLLQVDAILRGALFFFFAIRWLFLSYFYLYFVSFPISSWKHFWVVC